MHRLAPPAVPGLLVLVGAARALPCRPTDADHRSVAASGVEPDTGHAHDRPRPDAGCAPER